MAPRTSPQAGGWLGWAAYLGVSWTWCIGMFLPLLLIRDFGNVGWWIFAVPNVVGAAAMGWVLYSPMQSEQVIARNRLACEIFSAVTIAFHLYFVATIVPLVVHQTALPLITFAVIAAVCFAMIWQIRSIDRWLAGGIWLASLVIAGLFFSSTENYGQVTITRLVLKPIDYVGLSLVCLLGFLTCPYLDLTFHRARQFSTGPRRSFGVGFGIVFFSMVIFTYYYAHLAWTALPPLLLTALGTHLVLQSGFTVAAHANELRRSGAAWSAVLVLVAISIGVVHAAPRTHAPGELPVWELGYRTFMGFYGLVFPAYVWLVMLPRAEAQKKWLVFFTAIVAAAPAYALGFLLRDYRWLNVGVAFVILPRLFLLKRRTAPRVQQNSAPI